MRTAPELPYLAFLASTFFVTLGAMATPIILALTRPIHAPFKRLARRAVWNACKAAIARVVRWFVAVATAGVALAMIVAVFTSAADAQPHDAIQKATPQAIERMIGVLEKAAKHPVVIGAQVFSRGFMAVKVYRLSKEVKGLKTDVAALNTAVHGILAEVTGVIARLDAGEQLTAAELEAVNVRIDVHAVRIDAAEAEIVVLKHRMDEAERKARDVERRQREIERQQREQDQRQREAEVRQRETGARLAEQRKRMNRDSKTPNLYFDPKCNCRRDSRERDTGKDQVTAAAAK